MIRITTNVVLWTKTDIKRPENLHVFFLVVATIVLGFLVSPIAGAVKAAVEQALLPYFERDSVAPERIVLAEALRMGVGTADVHEVAGEAYRQGLITQELDGRRLSTLPTVLRDEETVLKFARESRFAVDLLNAAWTPEVSWLSNEQANAIEQLTRSHDRLQLNLGGAGTGKVS